MKILDLFCGQGGWSKGENSAGSWLGYFGRVLQIQQMIVKKTNRNTFKRPGGSRTLHDDPGGSSSLAVIPYPLSQAVLDKIKEKERAKKIEND